MSVRHCHSCEGRNPYILDTDFRRYGYRCEMVGQAETPVHYLFPIASEAWQSHADIKGCDFNSWLVYFFLSAFLITFSTNRVNLFSTSAQS